MQQQGWVLWGGGVKGFFQEEGLVSPYGTRLVGWPTGPTKGHKMARKTTEQFPSQSFLDPKEKVTNGQKPV